MSNRKGKGKVVSRTELAEFFGVSGPTIDHWVRTGCPYVKRGGKGVAWQFSTAEVHAWRIERERSTDDQSSREELVERRERAKTIREELELAKATGEVAYLDEVERALASAFGEVRTNMRNIASRVPSLLVGEADEKRIKRVLLDEIDQALEALASSDLVDANDIAEA